MEKYPWEKWFARKRKYRLLQGRDFTIMPHSMSVLVRNAAQRHGLRVSISTVYGQKNIPTLLVENIREN